MFKNFNFISIVSIIIIGLFVGAIFVYADWTTPKFSPTRCDSGDPGCDAPINVGSNIQWKDGLLRLLGLTVDFDTYLAVQGGNVGIGTTMPQAKLDVEGGIKVKDYINVGNQIVFEDKLLSSQTFYFRCSRSADWTNIDYCAWTYVDHLGIRHYSSGTIIRSGYANPTRCDNPFAQPASGPALSDMMVIFANLTPAVKYATDTNHFEKIIIESVSGINSWVGQNFCAGGGTDGDFGNVTVNLRIPYIGFR